jgi:ATP-dependent helicase/nuclease subunit A
VSIPVDQATRDLVSRDGLAQTLFVEAGAGTGKTTQLVDRIANLVLVEGVRLSNIAAITFTEAAAAELQSRIREKFERRAAEATDETERQRCVQAIADVDMAALSTLHGFASRLLNEFAVAAGLPPRVRVLDEVSSQLAHEERWERFVDALYDDPAHEAVLMRARRVRVAFEPQYQGHATLKDVAAELNGNWDRLTALANQEPPPISEPDFTPFDEAVAAVCRLPRVQRLRRQVLPPPHRGADPADDRRGRHHRPRPQARCARRQQGLEEGNRRPAGRVGRRRRSGQGVRRRGQHREGGGGGEGG